MKLVAVVTTILIHNASQTTAHAIAAMYHCKGKAYVQSPHGPANAIISNVQEKRKSVCTVASRARQRHHRGVQEKRKSVLIQAPIAYPHHHLSVS